MDRTPAVELDGVRKRYGRRLALDDLSLRVERGQVTALLGPNGAGKTTTVEICEGFRRPDAGAVRVLGRDPRRAAGALRPRVGVMLQQGGLHPSLPAAAMLRLVAGFHARPLSPDLLIERLGLTRAAGTTCRRLSGGEQQRLKLAMAVVGRPELVFLDEPTTGLDPQARHATWKLIEQLRCDGVTVVLTTHFMEEAERLAAHVCIVDRGRLVASGTPAELTAERGPRLAFSAPPGLPVDALAQALPGRATVCEAQAGRYLVDAEVDPGLIAAVTAWCAERGALVERLDVRRRTLEDVFLEFTGRELRG